VVGSPATAWLTSRIERRTLLVTMLAFLALINLASALVPHYATQTFVLPTSMVFAGIAGWAVGAGICPDGMCGGGVQVGLCRDQFD